ncbi:MAG: hypothetical protein ABR499_01190 [Gemmatimonadaceae bacterium]
MIAPCFFTMTLPCAALALAAGDSPAGSGRSRALALSFSSGSGGTVLDPTSTANPLTIARSITLWLAAFEDDDKNGTEDNLR